MNSFKTKKRRRKNLCLHVCICLEFLLVVPFPTFCLRRSKFVEAFYSKAGECYQLTLVLPNSCYSFPEVSTVCAVCGTLINIRL